MNSDADRRLHNDHYENGEEKISRQTHTKRSELADEALDWLGFNLIQSDRNKLHHLVASTGIYWLWPVSTSNGLRSLDCASRWIALVVGWQ